MEEYRCEHCRYNANIIDMLKNRLPDTQTINNLSEVFKVFGDPTRIKILWILFDHERCVYDISEALDMSQSAISHQLRVLKQMDLVKNRREGKTVFYSLADGHIKTILSQGIEHINE